MSIEARHVKRKQLSQYLDADFLKKERKSMESHNNFNNQIMANRKRLSTEMQKDGSNGSTNTNVKRSRVSESVSKHPNHFNWILINAFYPFCLEWGELKCIQWCWWRDNSHNTHLNPTDAANI